MTESNDKPGHMCPAKCWTVQQRQSIWKTYLYSINLLFGGVLGNSLIAAKQNKTEQHNMKQYKNKTKWQGRQSCRNLDPFKSPESKQRAINVHAQLPVESVLFIQSQTAAKAWYLQHLERDFLPLFTWSETNKQKQDFFLDVCKYLSSRRTWILSTSQQIWEPSKVE